MADVNSPLPSEDEDFDVVSDGNPVAVSDFDDDDYQDDEPRPKSKDAKTASATSIAVKNDDSDEAKKSSKPADDEPEEEEEEESIPEEDKPQEDEPATESEPEPESAPQPEPEVTTDEPAADDQSEQPEQTPMPSTATPAKTPKAKRGGIFSARSFLELILLIAVVGLGLWSWNLYSDNNDLKKQVSQLNNNPQVAIEKQTQSLISQVGKLIDLPKGETPTVANVSDAAQAKKQSAFFNNAQDGDKVLMYVKAGEAVLYRPSTNRIILVGPLTFTNSTASTSTPSTSSKQ